MRKSFLAVLWMLYFAPALAGAVTLSGFYADDPPPASPAEPGAGVTGGWTAGDTQGRTSPKAADDGSLESALGWFVGPMLWSVQLDLSALDPMTVDRGLPALDDRPFIIGVMAGIINDNWRYGGFFVTGAQSEYAKVSYVYQRQDLAIGDPRIVKQQWRGGRITLDAYGVFIDYDREYKTAMAKKYSSKVPYLRYGYLVGGILAFGTLGIETYGDYTNWSTQENLLIVDPYVGAWISPFDWIWLQVEVGYIYIFMNDMQYEASNVPIYPIDHSGVPPRYGKLPLVDGAVGGGPHIGFKLVFGSNPNFKVRVAPPR